MTPVQKDDKVDIYLHHLSWLYQRIVSPNLRYSKPETELTLLIGTTVAVFPSDTGLPLLQFPGTRATVDPRGRDDAIVGVVRTEHGDLTTKRAARGNGLSDRLVHHQRKDEIGRRALGEREEGVLGPIFERRRQLFILLGMLWVHPNLDVLVELLEEIKRDARDFELANYVPRDECVEDLFRDVERREVLNLKR